MNKGAMCPKEERILVCDCSSVEHQLVFMWFPNDEDNIDGDYPTVYVSAHLFAFQNSFARRLWRGIKYILGYKCKYGQWDEVCLSNRHADKLQEIVNVLRGEK